MARYYRKGKLNVKNIISIVLVCALTIGSIAGLGVLFGKDTKTISPTVFSRGSLTPDGLHEDNDQALYTKDSFSCIGLRVEPDFEFKGTYDVYYYDRDERLLEVKTDLTGVYDEDYPLAQRCRIVIYPDKPEDVSSKDFKINFWEVMSYAKQLKVIVDKKQEYVYGDCPNLYIENNVIQGQTFDSNGYDTTLTLVEDSIMKVTEDIVVTGEYNYYDIFIRLETPRGVYSHAVVVADADDKILTRAAFNMNDLNAGEWCKLTVEIPTNYEGDMYLKVRMPLDSDCYIYGYND